MRKWFGRQEATQVAQMDKAGMPFKTVADISPNKKGQQSPKLKVTARQLESVHGPPQHNERHRHEARRETGGDHKVGLG